jgi:hypothetical protein
MIRFVQFAGIIGSMHLLGTAILFGYASGPLASLAAPILSLFGWFFVFPEIIGVGLQWVFYDPCQKPTAMKILGYAVMSALIGGIFVSLFTPKEQGNEAEFWIAGFLGGSVAAVYSFFCIHWIKTIESRKYSEQGADGKPPKADQPPHKINPNTRLP